MFTVKQLAFDGMQVWGVACYKHIFRCLSGPFSIQRRHLRLNRLEHLGWTSGRVLNQNDFCRCCLLSAKLEWTIGFVRETDCLMEIGFVGPDLKDACSGTVPMGLPYGLPHAPGWGLAKDYKRKLRFWK